jgi:hypothetical protein
MNPETEKVADAVLYEGYMLYPYRLSAVKNRQRWNFGVVYPKAYSEQQNGVDACMQQTECMIAGSESSAIEIKVRFLQTISRQVAKPNKSSGALAPSEPDLDFVESLVVGSKVLRPWQEATPGQVVICSTKLSAVVGNPLNLDFALSGSRELEAVPDADGATAAFFVRTSDPLSGRIEVSASRCADSVFRITVRILNLTRIDGPEITREHALRRSLLSAHTILSASRGQFVSLLDPPEHLKAYAESCRNVGTWPVMTGDERMRNEMLSSPIILYDYPQVAPESPGDLFDGTEIDEILALRILTLSDAEKSEIAQSDTRARDILQRTEALPAEHFMKLHGVLRGLRPSGDAPVESAAEAKDER